MMDYSRVFGSQFPDSLIEVGTKQDVDNSVITLVNQYYSYIQKGDMDSANRLYNSNKSLLESRKIGMEDFNSLQEELYNIGLNVLQQTTLTVSSSEPLTMGDNGVWYELLEVVE